MDYQVFDAHVGEGAAGHHAVVAAARAVAVEIFHGDTAVEQELSGGRCFLDAAGGRNVVGGDAVAENAQGARTFDLADFARLQ